MLYIVTLLFILLSPGLLVTIPKVGKSMFRSGKTSTMAVLVHAIIFTVCLYAYKNYVNTEGFQNSSVVLSTDNGYNARGSFSPHFPNKNQIILDPRVPILDPSGAWKGFTSTRATPTVGMSVTGPFVQSGTKVTTIRGVPTPSSGGHVNGWLVTLSAPLVNPIDKQGQYIIYTFTPPVALTPPILQKPFSTGGRDPTGAVPTLPPQPVLQKPFLQEINVSTKNNFNEPPVLKPLLIAEQNYRDALVNSKSIIAKIDDYTDRISKHNSKIDDYTRRLKEHKNKLSYYHVLMNEYERALYEINRSDIDKRTYYNTMLTETKQIVNQINNILDTDNFAYKQVNSALIEDTRILADLKQKYIELDGKVKFAYNELVEAKKNTMR